MDQRTGAGDPPERKKPSGKRGSRFRKNGGSCRADSFPGDGSAAADRRGRAADRDVHPGGGRGDAGEDRTGAAAGH